MQKPSIGTTVLYIIVLTFVINFVVWILTAPFEAHFLEGLGQFLAFPLAIFAVLKWRSGFDKESKAFETQYEQSQPKNQSERLDLSLNNAVTIVNPYSGVFICGGAGSGKSKSIVEPIIYDAGRKNFTGVVYDFKFPELAMHVEQAYQNSDVKRYYVNFSDLNTSNLINPIAPNVMRSASFAREFASSVLQNINPQSISKPDFWSDNSQALLSAVFWYLREEQPQICTLPHAISLVTQPNYKALIKLLQTNPQCADMVAPIASAIDTGANSQIGAVMSSLQVSLNKINTPEMYYVTGQSSDFDLNVNDKTNKSILTVGNDPVLAGTYGPVIGLILTSVTKQLNQQGKEKSMILLDEFPTVFVPNIQTIPATGRSNKVATILACQDITQVVDMYGKSKADTILSNLGNQFYGRTTNPDTAKRVSQMFGREDVMMTSKSDNYGGFLNIMKKGTSTSYSMQEKEVVKVQEVATLQTGTFFTILSEGSRKMGQWSIPLDNSFRHHDLPKLREITDDEVNYVYLKIKNEALELLNTVV